MSPAVPRALVGVIAIYLVTVTVQSRRIVAEAAKAEQVKEMLVSLFTAANPAVSQGQERTASDLLDMGARRVAELQRQPDGQAELMAVLGQVYGTLGRYDEAADLLLPALELRRRHLGLYRSSLAASEGRFGVVDPIASLTRSELALLLSRLVGARTAGAERGPGRP
jgi:eukaryotic-like serine/threonine-protein kinase